MLLRTLREGGERCDFLILFQTIEENPQHLAATRDRWHKSRAALAYVPATDVLCSICSRFCTGLIRWAVKPLADQPMTARRRIVFACFQERINISDLFPQIFLLFSCKKFRPAWGYSIPSVFQTESEDKIIYTLLVFHIPNI